jgi:5'-3' exonuclease
MFKARLSLVSIPLKNPLKIFGFRSPIDRRFVTTMSTIKVPVKSVLEQNNSPNLQYLAIFDAFSLLIRGHYGMISKPLRNRQGRNISGLYILCQSIARLSTFLNATHVAIAMDTSTPSFRKSVYSDYKMNRPLEKDPEIVWQLQQIPR